MMQKAMSSGDHLISPGEMAQFDEIATIMGVSSNIIGGLTGILVGFNDLNHGHDVLYGLADSGFTTGATGYTFVLVSTACGAEVDIVGFLCGAAGVAVVWSVGQLAPSFFGGIITTFDNAFKDT
jgi:hypothetical protein